MVPVATDVVPSPGEHHSSYPVSTPDSLSSPDCCLSLQEALLPPTCSLPLIVKAAGINGRHSQKKYPFSLGEIAFMEFSRRDLRLSPSSLRSHTPWRVLQKGVGAR